MRRINVTKWAVGLVAVLGLALGLASHSEAAAGQMSLSGTSWATLHTLSDGQKVVAGLSFTSDREYQLLIIDAKDQRVLVSARGTYTVSGDNIKMYDQDGKLVGDELIVSLTPQQFVVRAEGKTTVWDRLPAGN